MATEEDEFEARDRRVEQYLEEIRVGEQGLEAKFKLWLAEDKRGKVVKEGTKALDNFTKSVAAGAISVSNSTGKISDMEPAITGVIDGMTALTAWIPFVGDSLTKLADASKSAISFGMKQTQAGYDSFTELAEAGLVGGDGVKGLAKQIADAGVPLATWTKMVKSGSEDLAFFSSSALSGGNRFAKTMDDMAGGSGDMLRNLGFNVEDIGETVMNFTKMQRRQGFMSELSQAELIRGSQEYGKELDMIAKLTGKSRKDIQKEREDALSDSRFQAALMELDKTAQEKHLATLNQISDPQIKRAYMDNLSGITNTTASIAAQINGMGGSIQKAQDQINSGAGGSVEAINLMISGAREATKLGGIFQSLAKVWESGEGPMGNFGTMRAFATQEFKSVFEVMKSQVNAQDPEINGITQKLNYSIKEFQHHIADVNSAFVGSKLAAESLAAFTDLVGGSISMVQTAIDSLNGESSEEKVQRINTAKMTIQNLEAKGLENLTPLDKNIMKNAQAVVDDKTVDTDDVIARAMKQFGDMNMFSQSNVESQFGLGNFTPDVNPATAKEIQKYIEAAIKSGDVALESTTPMGWGMSDKKTFNIADSVREGIQDIIKSKEQAQPQSNSSIPPGARPIRDIVDEAEAIYNKKFDDMAAANTKADADGVWSPADKAASKTMETTLRNMLATLDDIRSYTKGQNSIAEKQLTILKLGQ